ncbi:hypothetical protein, partial [Shigella sonnei]|uniref:hypothetical protein n=1 Tax=Shigella sonnei TaxID=624 RepID=UPI001C12CA49
GADATKSAPDLAASLKAAMAGQQGGNGQASSGKQDASLGQPYKAPLQLGDAGKNNAPVAATAAAPANPMQLAAAMRAAEPAST